MKNRCDLAQLRDMTLEQACCLPTDQVAALLEDVADLKADAKRLDDLLTNVLTLRYADAAALARREAGKDTGTVSIPDGDLVVKADLPKKVEWNQAELRKAMEVVESWDEEPADYLSIVLSVPESRYNAWPDSIRKVFEPARIVGVGKATFKIERAKRMAA